MDKGTASEEKSLQAVTSPYEETFKRMETRIRQAFKLHQQRIDGIHNLLAASRKKTQNSDQNHPLVIILTLIDKTTDYMIAEIKENNRLVENLALQGLALVRDGANNRELMRQLAFQMIQIATRDEQLKELQENIRKMVIDADTKYKDAINFLEKVNKNLDQQSNQQSKEPGEYIG